MYKCLKREIYPLLHDCICVPIRYEDRELIREWRNAQTAILRQEGMVTQEAQEKYFTEILFPSFQTPHPFQILLSILDNGECIGYGGLVHINWHTKRAEISFLLTPSIQEGSPLFEELFMGFIQVVKEIAFHELLFHKLTAETYAIRPQMPSLLAKCGFSQEGVLQDHIYKENRWVDAFLFGLIRKEIPENTMHKGVLISCISRKVPLIIAAHRASQKAHAFSCIHGCDMDEEPIAKSFVDMFWNVPSIATISLSEIIHYCMQHGVGAIIPTKDAELLFWAQKKEELAKKGIQVMVSSEEAISLCQDKKAFQEFLQGHEYMSIPTFSEIEKEGRYVVKERFGAGARGIGLNLSCNEAKRWAKSLNDPIFQPYIEGTEYSVDLYVAKNNKVHGAVVRIRDLVVSGESQMTTTIKHPELEKCIIELAQDIGLYGHAVFQVIEAEERFFIVECNPRFGGASTASIEVGLDTFSWFFLECQGESLDTFPFMRKEDITQIRYPKDMIFHSPYTQKQASFRPLPQISFDEELDI